MSMKNPLIPAGIEPATFRSELDGLGVNVPGFYMRGNGSEFGQGYQITLGL